VSPASATTARARSEAAEVVLSGLGKRYDAIVALQEVSLELPRSRFLVLLGPSGSGKSTLIRCLAGIERPTEGEIRIGGEVVSGAGRHVPPERRDLAMVFQDFALWPHLTVGENVAFPLRRRRVARREAERRSSEMLARVGLHSYRERYPHELSGGEQQRVALARALVGRPRLLLFDEPLSSLDAGLRERLRLEIGTLVREHDATAVYITHDQGEAFALGDEIGLLQAGRLVQLDSPESIYRRPATPFVARFTGLSGVLEGRLLDRGGPGGPPVRVLVPAGSGARAVEMAGCAMEELDPGDAVQVMLRPTAVSLCAPDDPEAVWRGSVRDAAFHGRGYDHAVAVGEELTLTGIFDRHRFGVESSAGLRIDPREALVFAREPSSSAAAPRVPRRDIERAAAPRGEPLEAIVPSAGGS